MPGEFRFISKIALTDIDKLERTYEAVVTWSRQGWNADEVYECSLKNLEKFGKEGILQQDLVTI